MQGVYQLLGVQQDVPAIYQGLHHPVVAFNALRTALA
jgi:hypothetical protein